MKKPGMEDILWLMIPYLIIYFRKIQEEFIYLPGEQAEKLPLK